MRHVHLFLCLPCLREQKECGSFWRNADNTEDNVCWSLEWGGRKLFMDLKLHTIVLTKSLIYHGAPGQLWSYSEEADWKLFPNMGVPKFSPCSFF